MGNMYKKNDIGPKIDSWGMPHKNGEEDEENSPRWTEKLVYQKQLTPLFNPNTLFISG